MELVKTYVQLTKPRIVFGNLITTIGGFFLQGHIELSLLCLTLLAIACVMGAGCVLNNCIDFPVDKKMMRTQHRALAQGNLPLIYAIIFGISLALFGLTCLFLTTNLLTTSIALFGLLIYPFIYSWMKMHTIYATHVGSLAGAVPPLVGYCAAGHPLDLGALLLFLTIALWQMPHFFAIAIYRLKDYTSAHIPVFPAIKGINTTKRAMRVYIVAFILTVSTLALYGYIGLTVLIPTVLSSLIWLLISGSDPEQWARRMFRYSLIVITLFSLTICLST